MSTQLIYFRSLCNLSWLAFHERHCQREWALAGMGACPNQLCCAGSNFIQALHIGSHQFSSDHYTNPHHTTALPIKIGLHFGSGQCIYLHYGAGHPTVSRLYIQMALLPHI